MRGRQQPNERTYTFAHRQRLLRAIDVYLRWCYRHKTAARSSELAARLGVLPQYLSWIAPKILGKPLRVVLREKQLTEAERLLRHTPLSVEEIALRCAFGTPSTLYRWFIDRHGIAPAAFRELKNLETTENHLRDRSPCHGRGKQLNYRCHRPRGRSAAWRWCTVQWPRMELCSSILHVYRRESAAVLHAVDLVMKDAGFVRGAIPEETAADYVAWMREEGLPMSATYLLSDPSRDWLTVIEADFVVESPETSELALRVSALLETFTLSMVTTDDMMYYNFFSSGRELDSYTSCPLHLEHELLSEEEIENQRHAPEELLPVLPVNGSISDVTALLNRGWWNAHDAGKLNEYGREADALDRFGSERERMTLFGTLLAFHGNVGEYPYAAWVEDPRIDWARFQIVAYRRAV